MSYSFQPRIVKDRFERKKRLVEFNAAISQQAKTSLRTKLREVLKNKKEPSDLRMVCGETESKNHRLS